MSMKTYQKTLAPVYATVLLAMAAPVLAKVPGIGNTGARLTPNDNGPAPATCTGTSNREFDLTARSGHITLGDGNTLLAWGYSADPFTTAAVDTGKIQYPGPTMIVCEGDTVTVRLHNRLPDPVSIVFPGQTGVTTAPAVQNGPLTRNVPAFIIGTNNLVTYTFTASKSGTYLYQSGTDIETQLEMGLVGALIVRPQGFADGSYAAHTTDRRAYGTASTAYDVEYLFFQTEMDRSAHEAMEAHLVNPGLNPRPNPANFKQTLWFLNGRNGPDTMLAENVAWLPLQPNNALAQMHPGDRVLMRLIGGGRDLHPFHHHGNNAWMIARDGRVLEGTAGSAAPYPDYAGIPASDLVGRSTSLPDQAVSNYTIQTVPGGTYDAIFTWTGKGVDWDIYGNLDEHKPGAACTALTRLPFEDPADHCKEFPVILPEQQALAFGGLWSGSQYLGTGEALPPLQGGLNPAGGFSYMWHSHTERELTNDDVFPGGMMTMMIVQKADSGAAIE
jgi:FtsP/CotA-like multicopper oxidase with cupredoxin domain